MPERAVIESEEEQESAPSQQPVIEESPARPAKQDGPQKATMPGAVIAAEQAAGRTGEQPGEPARRARAAHALQRGVGNKRAGQMMGGVYGAPKKADEKKPKFLPPITMPLPEGAKRSEKGAASLTEAGVSVVILPDAPSSAPKLAGRAKTKGNLHWSLPGYNESGGKVVLIKAAGRPSLTIQTLYGKGVTSKSPSAYGKGTTAEDLKAGNTSLGYHEGSHGQDFLRYLQDHPIPQFAGQVGMSVDDFMAAREDYDARMQAYQSALEAYSRQQTDCVGTPDEGCE